MSTFVIYFDVKVRGLAVIRERRPLCSLYVYQDQLSNLSSVMLQTNSRYFINTIRSKIFVQQFFSQ